MIDGTEHKIIYHEKIDYTMKEKFARYVSMKKLNHHIYNQQSIKNDML